MEGDLEMAKEQIEQAKAGIEKLKQELVKLTDQVKATDVRYFPPLCLVQGLTVMIG